MPTPSLQYPRQHRHSLLTRCRRASLLLRQDLSSLDDLSSLKLLQNPQGSAPPPSPYPSDMSPADPDLYRIGYDRSFRTYGVDFLEGPRGIGVFATRNVPALTRARVIMEVPLELMITVSHKPPWLFFPDPFPLPEHPLFDIVNSTAPSAEWDLRLASLLLFSLDTPDSFWQLYSDFLPSTPHCTSLLLASDDDLLQLQDPALAARAVAEQSRAVEFWSRNWHSQVPLKIRRLAPTLDRFLWALSVVQTRAFVDQYMRMGALKQQADMLIPYADMLNHSFRPNCFLHWRYRDRMLTVLINAGQEVKEGEEMTLNYMKGGSRALMERFGFSSAANPWDTLEFSGNSRIHLDTFLSVFDIGGLPDEYYHNEALVEGSGKEDIFVDGAVIAAARSLPTWSDGDTPPLPITERKAAKELQEECKQMLSRFPTTWEEDEKILNSNTQASATIEAIISYRMNRKLLIRKVIQALDIYQDRLLF